MGGVAADLEIGLDNHNGDGTSTVDQRLTPADSDAEVRDNGKARLASDDFPAVELDANAYGRRLGEKLFADEAIRRLFDTARATAQDRRAPLRVRLSIGPTAARLHELHWETLREPTEGASIVTSDRELFSRYIDTQDLRRVVRRRQDDLRSLVVIAHPPGIENYQPNGRPLAPIDVGDERSRAEAALSGTKRTVLAAAGEATIANVITRLRNRTDILYLVCHGALIDGKPQLWLEDEHGAVKVVAGQDLVDAIKASASVPQLVVLASCQSAGFAEPRSDDGGALAALGPRLAAAGVPAVLAMQGNVTMQTVKRFLPVFFRELRQHGEVDRAAAAARLAVTLDGRNDGWMPVVFMRLKSGRLWYAPGFDREGGQDDPWDHVRPYILDGSCVPILGPALTESLLGSRREMALKLVETNSLVLDARDREDLPHVAQVLAVDGGPSVARDQLLRYVHERLGGTQADLATLSASQRPAAVETRLAAAAANRWKDDPAEPHIGLARFPIKVYVTTNPDALMEGALTTVGKHPRSMLCRWSEAMMKNPPRKSDIVYQPTADEPLVFHVFGRLEQPTTIVLTEDDCFDFLIGAASNPNLLPVAVRKGLAESLLLFLGFRLDDWSFQVLFRYVRSRQRSALTEQQGYKHVAVQLDPGEDSTIGPEGVRRYVQRYFHEADVTIYWGSADDFVQEIANWAENTGAPAPQPAGAGGSSG
jgi:hypothetical protein